MNRAPGMLIAVSVIAITLGVLGFFAAAMGAVGAVAGEAIQHAFVPQPPAGNVPQIQQPVDQMQREVQAITDKWAAVNYSLLAVQMVLSGCLVFGGIQAFRLQPSGQRLLLVAFLLAIVFELVRLVPTISIQVAMLDVMERYMAEVMKAGAGGGRPMPPGMNRFMKAAMILGFAMVGAWLLIKLAFYGYGIYYLRRPQVAAAFEPTADLEWADDDADWSDDDV